MRQCKRFQPLWNWFQSHWLASMRAPADQIGNRARLQMVRENTKVLGKAEWSNSRNGHLNGYTESWGGLSPCWPSGQTLSKPYFHCGGILPFGQAASHWSQHRWLEGSWEGVDSLHRA